jgi:hypothetical protein
MTVKEFNEKYKQYLEEGHYGLDIDNPAVVSFLDELFSEYLTKIEGFQYSQIKMKYDCPRFYFTSYAGYGENEAIEYLVEGVIRLLLTWKS